MARVLAMTDGSWRFTCGRHGERHEVELDGVQAGGPALPAALARGRVPDVEWPRLMPKLIELRGARERSGGGGVRPLPTWAREPRCEVCRREPASIFTRWHGRWQFSCGGHGEEPSMMIDAVLAGGSETLDELAHWQEEGIDWGEFAAMLSRLHEFTTKAGD